ncbi:MAG: ATP-binding protein [Bacteroidetes bacterium]|nr:MAG: ATP-binding protein [Bacteroidota bacterium]
MEENFVVINELAIASSYNELGKVEALIEEVCRNQFSDQDVFGNVLIAVTEAVNNAIQHGNKEDSTKRINVVVEGNSDKVVFHIEDQGNGFDYTNLPDPTAPENIEKEDGRGIFLMKSLSDEVSFDAQGRKVLITFAK